MTNKKLTATRETQNNPAALHPETLNPKPLNPQTKDKDDLLRHELESAWEPVCGLVTALGFRLWALGFRFQGSGSRAHLVDEDLIRFFWLEWNPTTPTS